MHTCVCILRSYVYIRTYTCRCIYTYICRWKDCTRVYVQYVMFSVLVAAEQ